MLMVNYLYFTDEFNSGIEGISELSKIAHTHIHIHTHTLTQRVKNATFAAWVESRAHGRYCRHLNRYIF